MSEKQLHQNEVTLIAGGKAIKASKTSLSEASDYFKAMFSGGFAESSKDTINLEGVNGKCLLALIESLNGSFSYSIDQLIPLYETSSMLQFTKINETLEGLMRGSLSYDNCLHMYSTASIHGAKQLARAARTISAWKFSDVIKTDQYLELDLKGVTEYLKEPGLYLGSKGEWKIWEAIVDWIEFHEPDRKMHINCLVQILDFRSLKKDDMMNLLWYPLVSDDEPTVMLIKTIIKLTTGDEIEDDSSNNVTTKLAEELLSRPRRCPQNTTCVIGFLKEKRKLTKEKLSDDEEQGLKLDFERHVPVLYEYEESSGQVKEVIAIHKLMEGDTCCSGFKVCSVGPYIYFFGGEYQYGYSNWNQFTWCYNTITRAWIVQDTMPDVRRHFMCCALKDVIYLIGGYGKHRITQSSVSAFDTTTGEWHGVVDLPIPLFSGAACSYDNQILVFCFETIYCINPSYKNWVVYKLKCSEEISFKEAMTWGDYIFLTDHTTKKVFYIKFLEEKVVHFYGEFQYHPNNVCLKDGKIYSFTADEDDSAVIEVMDVSNISNVKTISIGSTYTVWKDDHKQQIKFLPHNISNSSFYSYGCFSLFKC